MTRPDSVTEARPPQRTHFHPDRLLGTGAVPSSTSSNSTCLASAKTHTPSNVIPGSGKAATGNRCVHVDLTTPGICREGQALTAYCSRKRHTRARGAPSGTGISIGSVYLLATLGQVYGVSTTVADGSMPVAADVGIATATDTGAATAPDERADQDNGQAGAASQPTAG